MNQDKIKAKSSELAAFYTAKANGRTLQYHVGSLGWMNEEDTQGPDMDSDLSRWRVKPEEVKEKTVEVLP